jgi:hypothetical protein
MGGGHCARLMFPTTVSSGAGRNERLLGGYFRARGHSWEEQSALPGSRAGSVTSGKQSEEDTVRMMSGKIFG